MKRLAIKALALSIALVPAAAFAGGDSGRVGHGGMHGVRMPTGVMHGGGVVKGGMIHNRNMGNHRWVGGTRAPGGWNAYRRPFVGYVLPRYWINPTFYIPNYSYFGLSQPSYGYGWSRYYDDAVLTDRYGRVYDSVSDLDWEDRRDASYGEDYSDSYGYSDDRVVYDNRYYDDPYYGAPARDDRRYRGKDRDGGLGGALAGGAVGALAGGLIAKKGDNTAGVLLGGAVGAMAGAAIDAGDKYGRTSSRKRLSKKDRYDPRLDYDYGYDGGYGPHWNQAGPAPYPAHPGPHPSRPVVTQGGSSQVIYSNGGYGYGYGYGQPTVTTVIVQPAPVTKTVTTTTEYVTETVYVKPAVKRVYHKPAPKRAYKPKPRCVCKVVYR